MSHITSSIAPCPSTCYANAWYLAIIISSNCSLSHHLAIHSMCIVHIYVYTKAQAQSAPNDCPMQMANMTAPVTHRLTWQAPGRPISATCHPPLTDVMSHTGWHGRHQVGPSVLPVTRHWRLSVTADGWTWQACVSLDHGVGSCGVVSSMMTVCKNS